MSFLISYAFQMSTVSGKLCDLPSFSGVVFGDDKSNLIHQLDNRVVAAIILRIGNLFPHAIAN